MILLLTTGPASAQATAQLSGTVRDESGAVLPGVTVTVTQTDTGFTRTVVTEGTGGYVMPNLPTGPYRLEVSLAGFRTYEQTGIVLQVAAAPVINAVLAVGSLEETVSVEAATPLVDVRSAGISAVVENERMEAGRSGTEQEVMRNAGVGLLALLLSATASGQGQAPIAPPRDVAAPAIPGVVAAGTRIALVKYPVQGTEGPVGLPDGSGILFTETRADHITKVDASGNTSTFVEKSNGSNGLGFDPNGRLISVQRAPGNERVGVLYPPGSEATLVDNFEGKPFNRLNDLVVSSKGGIYFTDTQGVYYLPPGGQVKKVIQGIKNPNGVQLSPDEKTAYANDKDGEYLLAFDVQPDGTLTNRRNFGKYKSLTVPGHKDPLLAEDNGADGLAVDSEGRVYVATNLGVEVFSLRGEHLGVIPIGIWGGEQNMLRKPQNLAFSGPDKKTLYTVGANAIFKVQLIAQGFKGRGK